MPGSAAHFSHSSADGLLARFHVLALMSKDAVDFRVQAFVPALRSLVLGVHLGVELPGHTVTLLNLLRKEPDRFSKPLRQGSLPSRCMRNSASPSPFLSTLIIVCLFDDSHSPGDGMASHWF